MKNIILILFLGCLLLSSCSSKFMKYESNWIITKFEEYGKDATSLIVMYNFKINVNLEKATPPAVDASLNGSMKVISCKIDFYSEGDKDYIKLSNHYFFSGIYEIKCLDKSCCKIVMKNERIYMEMEYNGDLPFGISRACRTFF